MLKCWEEDPSDRPTFAKLKDTMKEMERNNRVTYLEIRALKRGPENCYALLFLNFVLFRSVFFLIFFAIHLDIRLVTVSKSGRSSL